MNLSKYIRESQQRYVSEGESYEYRKMNETQKRLYWAKVEGVVDWADDNGVGNAITSGAAENVVNAIINPNNARKLKDKDFWADVLDADRERDYVAIDKIIKDINGIKKAMAKRVEWESEDHSIL
jgi:hypothetical protein